MTSGAQFTFDHVFGQSVTDNKAIFDQVAKEVIDSTLDGINGKRMVGITLSHCRHDLCIWSNQCRQDIHHAGQ